MLAGKEASMDGETLFDRSSRAGRSGGQDWRDLMPPGGKAGRGEHQHGPSLGAGPARDRERCGRQDRAAAAKNDLWPAPEVALAKDQGRRLHFARTGGRACRTWSESGLPDRLELRPRRETQFQKKAWWPASATVPTSYGGAHSGGSIKTRSSPSVSSSSMRLGPRPTWHHCGDGGRGAEGSKPKSRTVTGTRRRSWLRCVSIGSRRRGFLRVRSTVRPSKSMSKESLSPRFVPATS